MRSLRVLIVLLLVPVAGCNTTAESKRFTRNETSGLLKKLEVVSLELGEFPFDGPAAVIDGDTVNVYFYEDGNFKTVTFDMTSGEYVENADTYRTPGVRRTANGMTVWTRPVMNSTDPRGWGYTPAKA